MFKKMGRLKQHLLNTYMLLEAEVFPFWTHRATFGHSGKYGLFPDRKLDEQTDTTLMSVC